MSKGYFIFMGGKHDDYENMVRIWPFQKNKSPKIRRMSQGLGYFWQILNSGTSYDQVDGPTGMGGGSTSHI
jgi:hypothetical protein